MHPAQKDLNVTLVQRKIDSTRVCRQARLLVTLDRQYFQDVQPQLAV